MQDPEEDYSAAENARMRKIPVAYSGILCYNKAASQTDEQEGGKWQIIGRFYLIWTEP